MLFSTYSNLNKIRSKMSVCNNHSAYCFCGQDNFLGGQFWAMGRFNLLGGQTNLLCGQSVMRVSTTLSLFIFQLDSVFIQLRLA